MPADTYTKRIAEAAWNAINFREFHRKDPPVFVLTHEQRAELVKDYGGPTYPYQVGTTGGPDTFFGRPVILAQPDWTCLDGLEDLRNAS